LCLGGVEMHDAFKKTLNSNDRNIEDFGNKNIEREDEKKAYLINYRETMYAQQEVENYIAIMIIALIICFCFYVIKVL